MASTGMMAGMQGVFLVAAELSRQGFIVSTTSRNALGADLLVTDQSCQRTWSVQVKTNNGKKSFWLTGEKALRTVSKSHVYVFVNLRGEKTPQFAVVSSKRVATETETTKRSTGSVWYSFTHRFNANGLENSVGWDLFGDPEGHA